MGLVLGWSGFVLGFVLSHTAALVWAALMLPNPVERARQRIERRPTGSFFIGLGFIAVTLIFSGILLSAKLPPFQLLGWLFMGPMLAAGILGGAAFSHQLAARVKPEMVGGSRLSALLLAAFCTAVAGWMPVIGWFVFFPVTACISVGAGLMAVLSRRRLAELAPRPAPSVPAVGYTPAEIAWPEQVVPAGPPASA